MAKYQSITTENNDSVLSFIKKLPDPKRQKDALAIAEIMQKQSGAAAKMWGTAIIGFGSYHYVYDSGHEGDAPLVGFSPRKSAFALYIANFEGKTELLEKLGKHKSAKACVYINKVEDIDINVLKKLVAGSVKHCKAKYK